MTRRERVQAIMRSARRWRPVKRRLRRWAQDKPERRKERLARWTTIRNVCRDRAQHHFEEGHSVRARLWRRRRRWAFGWMVRNQPPPPQPEPTGCGSVGHPDWSGGASIVREEVRPIAAKHGAPLTSAKRPRDHPLSIANPGSDHNEANTSAYAEDYGTFRPQDIARDVGRALGAPFVPVGTFEGWNILRCGRWHRQQGLALVAGHNDHYHHGSRFIGLLTRIGLRFRPVAHRFDLATADDALEGCSQGVAEFLAANPDMELPGEPPEELLANPDDEPEGR